MSARGLLCSGDLYINRQVGGTYQGWEGPFLAEKFEIKADSELREKISKGRDTFGQIIASAAIPKPFDLNITLGEADKVGLSIALLGTVAALTQSSGTLTAVDVVAALDKWVPLTKAALTGSPVLTNTGATVTYVNGTDYIVNKQLGWIKVLSTGAILDAAALKFTSTYAAITGSQVQGATQSSIRAKFKLDGKNLADDTPLIVTVQEGVVASKAAVDFLSGQFVDVPLSGRMVTPAGFNEPFTIDQRASA